MLNIAIIGCGQIGSRHLQALASIKEDATIFLVDSNNQSIDTAKKRFKQVLVPSISGKFIVKVREIDKIQSNIDFAIISTTSSNRAAITRSLLSSSRVKYIIFEKFLFSDRQDYKNIQDLLKAKKVEAWVNQWMSSSNAFQEMNNWVGDDLQEISVSGENWGMACNSVHFIEYFDVITGGKDLKLVDCNIDSKILESKRLGYFELTGSITIESESGVKMNISCDFAKNIGFQKIQMIAGSKSLEATLVDQNFKCNYYDALNGNSFKEQVIPYQSEMTGSILEGIYLNESCSLPTYEQSIKHHLLLFDCFQNVFKKQLNLNNICPIT
jgi:hypothetical protein